MLQFIVLGFVPGTHIQLTFGWLVIFVAVVSSVLYIALHYQQVQNLLNSQINIPRKKTSNKPLA